MSSHFTDQFVWTVSTDQSSIAITDSVLAGLKKIGVNGIYLNASDPKTTNAKRLELIGKGFKVGLFCQTSSRDPGAEIAKNVSDRLTSFGVNDGGQTPVLLDFEPSQGQTIWKDFIPAYRSLRPGRVTDYYADAVYQANAVPCADLQAAHIYPVISGYYGDMSIVALDEAIAAHLAAGFTMDQIHVFYDGGRKNPPPNFYNGQPVRALRGGTIIWNIDLLRERGLV